MGASGLGWRRGGGWLEGRGKGGGGAWAWRRRRTPDVGRDEDAVLEVLEGLVELDALRLLDARVDGHRGEVALLQQLVKLDGTLDGLDEDHDLVELKCVQKFVEFAIFLVLCQLYVVLLQPVQGELAIIDVDLHRVLHELFADNAHLFRKCR